VKLRCQKRDPEQLLGSAIIGGPCLGVQPHPPARATEWKIEHTRLELQRLLGMGILGAHQSVEVTELFACPRGGAPFNVLSVLVLDERAPDVASPKMLTESRIQVPGLKDLGFGIKRYRASIDSLHEALETYETSRVWSPSGQPLQVGNLEPQRPEFAPADSTIAVPLNRVLKNNFWNGSHLLLLSEPDKTRFQPLLGDPRRLQALSDAVAKSVPWALAGLTDVLGDVVIQIPVTSVLVEQSFDPVRVGMEVILTWSPSASPRSVRVSANAWEDELVVGWGSSDGFTDRTFLPMPAHLGAIQLNVWDEEFGVLIASTGLFRLLNRIALNISVHQPEPRVFTALDEAGAHSDQRVALTSPAHQTDIGEDEPSRSPWRQRRIQLEEARRLEDTRALVQYRPIAGGQNLRTRALDDLRWLIANHGAHGAWLWDPYLSAQDLLQTLFFSPHHGAELRALTDGRTPPEQKTNGLPFAQVQRDVLQQQGGNLEGLRLEYRTRFGPEGWHFHDRFLIFPKVKNGPLAWSLGTSINSVGTAHHILQQVSNGAIIAGVFEDLWGVLDKPQHLVWRSW